ncbi:DUF5597 domain-containing protein [Bacteroidota bacterium]
MVASTRIVITFKSKGNDFFFVGIASGEERKFIDGKWIAGRKLDND